MKKCRWISHIYPGLQPEAAPSIQLPGPWDGEKLGIMADTEEWILQKTSQTYRSWDRPSKKKVSDPQTDQLFCAFCAFPAVWVSRSAALCGRFPTFRGTSFCP